VAVNALPPQRFDKTLARQTIEGLGVVTKNLKLAGWAGYARMHEQRPDARNFAQPLV
jgi:hypothetical protein